MSEADSEAQRFSSRSSTPNISNPGTPHQVVCQEVQVTPPLVIPSVGSTVMPLVHSQQHTPSIAAANSDISVSLGGNTGHVVPALPAHTSLASVQHISTGPIVTGTPALPLQAIYANSSQPQSKYSSLLAVIEEMSRDIRPSYAGNKTSSERLKRSIVHARILVRECLMECERSART